MAWVLVENCHVLERRDRLASGVSPDFLAVRRAGADPCFLDDLALRHCGLGHLAVNLALPALSALIPWVGLEVFANL